MSDIKAQQSLDNLGRALQRLREALEETKENSLIIDGTIQRFEFVFEMFWKTFKRLLILEGIQTSTPRESLKKAYEARWLQDEMTWLQMLKNRNDTSHVYIEELALQIYKDIHAHFPEMERTYSFLLKKCRG